MPTSHRTGGELAVDALARSGIRQAFTVPGESFLGLLDGLRDSAIRVTATRHEAGAAFMAEAYAQLSGEPALCLATRAVGAANLAIGLYTARQDSAPLVAIVGQVPRPYRGRESFQEVDQVESFGRLCKAAIEVDDPHRLHAEICRMVETARGGRPGPVLISIPEDVLAVRLPAETGPGVRETPPDASSARPELPERPAPSPEEVEAVLERLAVARRPLILAGAGILRSNATNMLRAFAELAQVPVIAAWRRPDVFPNELPLYLGMAGLGAARTVEPRLLQADLILAIGTRLSEITTFHYRVPGRASKLIQVDIEPGLPGDRLQPSLVVRSDARAFLRRALETLALANRLGIPDLIPSDRLAASRATDLERDRAAYLAAVALPEHPSAALVDPAAVVRALAAHLAPDAILTTDAGNFASWVARYVQIKQGTRFLGPTSGAMGYGLPAAIGAAIAARDGETMASSAVAMTARAAAPTGIGATGAVGSETVDADAIDMEAARAVEPDTAEPDTAEPDAVEPAAAEPDAAEPAAAEPDAVEPDAVEPDAAEPAAAEQAQPEAEPTKSQEDFPAAGSRQVIALAGDGGFAMLMAELETAVRERLRLAVLVFDNGMYGTIRMHQEQAHPGRVVATDLGPIAFSGIAEACGARAVRVSRDEEVEPAVAQALQCDGVTLVHILIDPRYLSVDRRLPG